MISPKNLSRKTTLCGAILAAVALPFQASALVELPSGTININTTLSGTYDSYFIGTFDHKPDYYATLSPQLSYTHNIGPSNLYTYVGVAINRYNTNSRFDSEDLSAGISSNFPVVEGSRLSGRIGASYSESTQIDEIVNDRVAMKSYQFDFSAAYRTGLKTNLSDRINYNRSERQIYGQQTIWSNLLAFSYADFLEDTNLNLSHTYTKTQSDAPNFAGYVYDPTLIGDIPDVPLDQTANTFNVGVAHPLYGQIIGEVVYGYMIMDRSAAETNDHTTSDKTQSIALNITGPLLPPERFPKVKSSARISYEQSTSQGINDSGYKSVVGNVNLSWNARERTRVSLGASRTQSLGSNNFSVATTQGTFGVTENIGLATTLNGSLNYTWRTYRGINRRDNVFEANASLSHALTKHWRLGATYLFQNNNTNAPTTSFQASRFRLENYTRHVVSLSISCGY